MMSFELALDEAEDLARNDDMAGACRRLDEFHCIRVPKPELDRWRDGYFLRQDARSQRQLRERLIDYADAVMSFDFEAERRKARQVLVVAKT